MSLIILKHKKCVVRQLRYAHDHWSIYLITPKPKKCVMMRWGITPSICSMSLIGMWHKQQIKIWLDYDDYYKPIEWYDGYQKRKAQKASIKEELMPIGWHPLRYRDRCMSEDEKKRQKNYEHKQVFFASDEWMQKNFFSVNKVWSLPVPKDINKMMHFRISLRGRAMSSWNTFQGFKRCVIGSGPVLQTMTRYTFTTSYVRPLFYSWSS